MIQHVYEHAVDSGANEVVIATDDERVRSAAQAFGATVCMTSAEHASGTDRLAEAAAMMRWADNDIVVNLQGDEPLMPAANIRQAAENLHAYNRASIATLSVPITSQQEFINPNAVKVVFDHQGYALYFSRAPIPCERLDNDKAPTKGILGFRHIGIYAYRAAYLKKFTARPACRLEQIERLEQLRALWYGEDIHVAECAAPPGIGVDTQADLAAVEKLITAS